MRSSVAGVVVAAVVLAAGAMWFFQTTTISRVHAQPDPSAGAHGRRQAESERHLAGAQHRQLRHRGATPPDRLWR